MPDDVLTIRGLTKKYKGRRGVVANDGVDLTVTAGSVVGLLGHNGAGKTTLANQIVGLLRPDAGTITLDGVDAIANPAQARRLTSVQAQSNVPITGLTPRTAIELVGRIRGGRRDVIAERTQLLLDGLDLGDWADVPAQKISGGVARLTAFAMAAVEPGKLVILDEPTNDVDPVRRRALWTQIRKIADDGAAVLLVTHNVREAESAVDELVILDRGKVIAADTPAGLIGHLQGVLQLELELIPGTQPNTPHWVTLTQRTPTHGSLTVPSDRSADAVEWAQWLIGQGHAEKFSLTAPSLEDVYIDLVGTGAAA